MQCGLADYGVSELLLSTDLIVDLAGRRRPPLYRRSYDSGSGVSTLFSNEEALHDF